MFAIKNILILTVLQLGSYSGVRYFFPMLTPFVYLCAVLYSGRSRFSHKLIFLFIIYMPIILISLITSTDITDLVFSLIKVTLPFALYAISYSAFRAEKYHNVERYLVRIILWVISIGFVECAARYYLAFSMGNNVLQNFYLAKINSPFFNDSNATALFLMTGLFITATLNPKNSKYKLFSLTLVLLVFLTLSRAAIVGVVVFVLMNLVQKLPLRIRFVMIVALFCLVAVSAPFFYSFVTTDGSGATKVQVYSVFLSKIISGDLSLTRILIGDGMSQGALTYGYQEGKFSHALIPMLVGQIGIIGAIFWLLFVSFSLIKVNTYLIFSIFVCIFIPGLSYAHPFYEFFYVALGIASSTRTWKNFK